MNILVFGMTKTYGGVESFFMNYYGKLHTEPDLHFDFLCITKEKIAYQDQIESYGGKIYRITARSQDPFAFKRELREFFSTHGRDYDVLWMNDNSLSNIDYLKEAKWAGIPHRIMHCHNDRDMSSRLQAILHRLHKGSISKWATDYWACSNEAADYCFSGPAREKALVITNAIDLTEKVYDQKKREAFREKYNLTDRFVIGNVGRLHFQKNQTFMIEVMDELVKQYKSLSSCKEDGAGESMGQLGTVKINEVGEPKNPVMIFIGTGPDQEKLEQLISEKHLERDILLLGRQDDIGAALSAMDLFLFPSVFEGLGIAALEAELNGLPVLASDRIPKVTGVNPNYTTMPLEEGALSWAERILEIIENKPTVDKCRGEGISADTAGRSRISSDQAAENLGKAGYDIDIEAPKLADLFREL